ncbi:MAG: hypothetical protein ACK5LP_03850 [Campylobacteraceae bacterium]
MTKKGKEFSFETLQKIHLAVVFTRFLYIALILLVAKYIYLFSQFFVFSVDFTKANIFIFFYIFTVFIASKLYIKNWVKNYKPNKVAPINRYMGVLVIWWMVLELAPFCLFFIFLFGGDIKIVIAQIILCGVLTFFISPNKEEFKELLAKEEK